MTTPDRLSLVRRLTELLRTAKGFESLGRPQQAAYRAQVTRLKGQITDPELGAVLDRIAEMIGEPETREARRMTVESLTEESATYATKTPDQRRAFKAKVSRFIGLNEDPAIKKQAAALLNKVEAIEAQEAESELLDLIAELDKESEDA